MADKEEKAANSGGGQGCAPDVEGDEGQCETLQHLTQSKTLAAFLGQLGQHQIAPDETLYKADDPILHIFYILRGRVEIRVANEVVGVVEGSGVLGAEEFHFRKSIPTYTQTTVAVSPTSVAWLDNHDLATVFKLDPDCAAAYLRLQAGLRKAITERLGGLKSRVVKLGAALEQTQDALLEKAPQKPRKFPPPPGELLQKWEAQCRTIGVLIQTLETRAEGLEGLLATLRQIAAKHPDWAKHQDFVDLLHATEALVADAPKVVPS